MRPEGSAWVPDACTPYKPFAFACQWKIGSNGRPGRLRVFSILVAAGGKCYRSREIPASYWHYTDVHGWNPRNARRTRYTTPFRSSSTRNDQMLFSSVTPGGQSG